jgi:hypothetical protein
VTPHEKGQDGVFEGRPSFLPAGGALTGLPVRSSISCCNSAILVDGICSSLG